ncbi:hypothetical protein HBO97_20710 [Pseudomonas lundensis]|uniref:hypothetical protein n=1 Tax=Pseudomonas lundensis TaxID=86185 RepID=UPI0014765CB9|nr:hypothetical protein [Pseudomonas lundensis]NNA36941.1 hypothetical protein [Pseudomonas lundensis]
MKVFLFVQANKRQLFTQVNASKHDEVQVEATIEAVIKAPPKPPPNARAQSLPKKISEDGAILVRRQGH